MALSLSKTLFDIPPFDLSFSLPVVEGQLADEGRKLQVGRVHKSPYNDFPDTLPLAVPCNMSDHAAVHCIFANATSFEGPQHIGQGDPLKLVPGQCDPELLQLCANRNRSPESCPQLYHTVQDLLGNLTNLCDYTQGKAFAPNALAPPTGFARNASN